MTNFIDVDMRPNHYLCVGFRQQYATLEYFLSFPRTTNCHILFVVKFPYKDHSWDCLKVVFKATFG